MQQGFLQGFTVRSRKTAAFPFSGLAAVWKTKKAPPAGTDEAHHTILFRRFAWLRRL